MYLSFLVILAVFWWINDCFPGLKYKIEETQDCCCGSSILGLLKCFCQEESFIVSGGLNTEFHLVGNQVINKWKAHFQNGFKLFTLQRDLTKIL